ALPRAEGPGRGAPAGHRLLDDAGLHDRGAGKRAAEPGRGLLRGVRRPPADPARAHHEGRRNRRVLQAQPALSGRELPGEQADLPDHEDVHQAANHRGAHEPRDAPDAHDHRRTHGHERAPHRGVRVGARRADPEGDVLVTLAPHTATPEELAALTEIDQTRESLRDEARLKLGVTGDDHTESFRSLVKRHDLSYYPILALGLLLITDTFQSYGFTVLAPEIGRALGISIGLIIAVRSLQ